MEVKWFCDDFSYDKLILSGDIGGTNTNLALIGIKNNKFILCLECVFPSQKLQDLSTAIEKTIEEGKKKINGLKIELACISGAGPVENNYCSLTNVSWDIDGTKIQNEFKIPTLVINDFMAISYGIPLLNSEDPDKILKIKHSDGSMPAERGSTKAVVGAGTGLGVGFLINRNGIYHAYPSEGGHIDFGPTDQESLEFLLFLKNTYDTFPDYEFFVSGKGIFLIYAFYKSKGKFSEKSILDESKYDETLIPARISKECGTNKEYGEIMNFFCRLYGRFAGNIALVFMPTAGLYLAGGIVSKNGKLFTDRPDFIDSFINASNPNLSSFLKTVPVYIINDYSISLFGAANAANTLMEKN